MFYDCLYKALGSTDEWMSFGTDYSFSPIILVFQTQNILDNHASSLQYKDYLTPTISGVEPKSGLPGEKFILYTSYSVADTWGNMGALIPQVF